METEVTPKSHFLLKWNLYYVCLEHASYGLSQDYLNMSMELTCMR
jgi:hypothetical protein